MISRSATKLIAEIYCMCFIKTSYFYGGVKGSHEEYKLKNKELYDFLYERDYDFWFLNATQKLFDHKRNLMEFIMRIHTGETLFPYAKEWTIKQREMLGQRYLKDLAEDIIEYCKSEHICSDEIKKLKSKLELDGYIWKDSKLLFPESDVLDSEEEGGILRNLVDELNLENKDTIFHHLQLSEDHYLNQKWDDSISNSRKFLESILQEVAAKHHMVENNTELSSSIYNSPRDVRDYLKNNELIEEKEKKAISSNYSLLSGTGGHPYIAEQDQARLLRHIALTFCQFVMLRLKGYISQKT